MMRGLHYFLGAIGLLVSGMLLAGQPVIASWTWKISSIASLVAFTADWVFRPVSRPHIAVTIASALLLGGSVTTSFLCTQLGSTPLPSPSAPTPSTIAVPAAHWDVQWHHVALLMLMLAFVVFLVLFVTSVHWSGPPRFESHWGGIGGGLTGWQMSPALSYLLVLGVVAVLFTAFMFHYEKPVEREEVKPQAQQAPAPVPAQVVEKPQSAKPTS